MRYYLGRLPVFPPLVMPICASCGVIAPRRCQACSRCGAAFAARPMTAPRQDQTGYWVAVRCTFQCRSCAFAAPLDQLDIDGSVECAYCGLRQRFEPSTWTEALYFAHAVGDLAGPGPEGRHPDPGLWIGPVNPFRDTGETLTFSEFRQSGFEMSDGMSIPKSLQIQAAPGFPVCARCRVTLGVQVMQGGRTTTTCPSCAETATFALPDRARAFGDVLIAVVAQEHRVNRLNATQIAPSQSGVSALLCPHCGAPLALHGADRTIKCQFCSAFCRVPGSFLIRSGQQNIEPEIWWMLFNGPSRKRRELESAAGADSVLLELPPLEKGVSYKQWLLNLAFLLGALWIGFEIASIDAVSALQLPDDLPAPTVPKRRAR
jgi:hypothetical protein